LENTNWKHIQEVDSNSKIVLHPGQSYVYGFEAFIATEGLWNLGGRQMATYQIHLLIGEGHSVSSPAMERRYIVNPKAWESEPIAEIHTRSLGLNSQIRVIEIGENKWLFNNRARLCALPHGATPKVSTDEIREFIHIEFEGSDEMPVVISNRTSHPVSGSERTVPHLYLWESITARSMGVATSETKPDKVSANTGNENQSTGNVPPNMSIDSTKNYWGIKWIVWVALFIALGVVCLTKQKPK